MSEASTDARQFIDAHRAQARRLGDELAEAIDDPETFVALLGGGLQALADPAYAETIARVSPHGDTTLAVRGPLMSAVQAPLRRALRQSSSASSLSLAQRLAQSERREVRMVALPCAERSLHDDPERTWQLLRGLGRGAVDWIEVDGMAPVWATGVLFEPFRWAELEQLVYSPRTMERRIVGATLACMPHSLPTRDRAVLVGDISEQSYRLIEVLIGDAEPMVQKSLSWAIREWTRIDAAGTARLLRAEADVAAENADGHRAWVIRDALSNQPPSLRLELRERLAGVRRSAADPPSSIAAGQAAGFTAVIAAADGVLATQGDRYTRSDT